MSILKTVGQWMLDLRNQQCMIIWYVDSSSVVSFQLGMLANTVLLENWFSQPRKMTIICLRQIYYNLSCDKGINCKGVNWTYCTLWCYPPKCICWTAHHGELQQSDIISASSSYAINLPTVCNPGMLLLIDSFHSTVQWAGFHWQQYL